MFVKTVLIDGKKNNNSKYMSIFEKIIRFLKNNIIFLSLIFLMIGSIYYLKYKNKKSKKDINREREPMWPIIEEETAEV